MKDLDLQTKIILPIIWLLAIGIDVLFYVPLSKEDSIEIFSAMIFFPIVINVAVLFLTVTILNITDRIKDFFGSIF